MQFNLFISHLRFFLILVLMYPLARLDAQLSELEKETLRQQTENLMKEYFDFRRKTASLLKQRDKAESREEKNAIRTDIYEMYKKQFLHQMKVAGDARVIFDCGDKRRKSSPNASVSFREFFNKNYLDKSEAADFKDFCVVKYHENQKKILVKYKSKYEVEGSNCRSTNRFYNRLAYFGYNKLPNGSFNVFFKELRFEDDHVDCLEGPEVISERPPVIHEPFSDPGPASEPKFGNGKPPEVFFIEPIADFAIETVALSLSAKIKNINKKDNVILLLNGIEQVDFDFTEQRLSKTLFLESGKNIIIIIAQNEDGRSVDRRIVEYKDPASTMLPTITFTNTPKDTIRAGVNLNIRASVTGLREEDQEKVILLVNGNLIPASEYQFIRGSLMADISLKIGKNNIQLIAANENGINVEELRIFNRKPVVVPDIILLHPSNEVYTDNPRVKDTVVYVSAFVQGVDSEKDIQILVNDKPIPFKYNPENKIVLTNFFDINARVKGTNTTVKIVAENELGEVVQQIIRFRYDDPCALVGDELNSCVKRLRVERDNKERWKKKAQKLQKEKNSLLSKNRTLKASLEKLQRQVHDSTLFIGINFNLIRSPYKAPSSPFAYSDPIDQATKNVDLSSFGISIYYLVGVWLANFDRLKTPLPLNHYTQGQINELSSQFDREGIAYKPLQYESTQANIFTMNYGVYVYTFFKPVPFYLMVGLSHAKGQVWDNYRGDFGNALNINPDGTYAIDMREINTQKPVLGLAYVHRFLQVEGGYDFLFKNYFLNLGANVPLFDVPTNHFYLKKSRR